MKIRYLLGFLVLLGVLALCTTLWVNEGPLWRLVMTKRVSVEGEEDQHLWRGWETRMRGSRFLHGIGVGYFTESGLKAIEVEYKDDDVFSRETRWHFDGTVNTQWSDDTGQIFGPPWLWGVEDQTKPTAPWWDHEKNALRDD